MSPIKSRSLGKRGAIAGWSLAFGVLLVMPAAAQTATPKAPPEVPAEKAPQVEHRDPKACSPRSETTGQDQALSEKLAQSDGVICPPGGVDPEIKMPTPEAGKTPVIPPPGSPGGDPTVRPK